MTDETTPNWVEETLKRYVVKKDVPTLPKLGRNVQAEIGRLQAVIDVVSKNNIPETELVRLRNKAQDLVNILNSRQ